MSLLVALGGPVTAMGQGPKGPPAQDLPQLCDRAYEDCKELTKQQDEQISGLKKALKETEKERDTAILRGDSLIAGGKSRKDDITKTRLWELGIFFFGLAMGIGSQTLK